MNDIKIEDIDKINFKDLYLRLINKDKNISDKDKIYLLTLAILFLNSKHENVRKLGYKIILKYSNLFEDYIPLYDVAINLNYIPICHFIEKMPKYANYFNNKFNNILMSSYCNLFKDANEIYYTGKQKELKEDFINYKDKDVLVIAPTSYGKSELVLSLIKDFDKIAIIVPTKALIYQYKSKISKFLKYDKEISSNIFTGIDSHKNSIKKYICILTQERLKAFIDKNIEFNIAFIDEAHNLLEDDERAHKLAECISKLKLQNDNIIFKFFTPFLNEPKNLTLEDETVSFENNSKSELIKIEENIKSENFYLVDFSINNKKLKFYDLYLDYFFDIKNISNYDYIYFILEYAKSKNLIYFNNTKNILNFLYKFEKIIQNKIVDNIKIKNAVKSISDYIGKDFILSKSLEKGILFHTGIIFENVKIYIEDIYRNNSSVRFLISSSTLLEGVNIPIDNMFIIEQQKGKRLLNTNQFKNLIGRACRLKDVFNTEEKTLDKLEPNIYILKDNNSKIDICEFIRKSLFNNKDNVKNTYLKYCHYKKRKDINKIKEKIESLKDFSFISNNFFDDNLYHNVSENEIDSINEKAKNIKNELSNKENKRINNILDLLEKTKEIFPTNGELRILKYKVSRNLYSEIIIDRIDSNYKDRINKLLLSIKKSNNRTKNNLVYVGLRFGEDKLNNNSNLEFIKYNKIDINLATFILKDFDDNIDYILLKYLNAMSKYEIIDNELFNKIKYRTTNKDKIKMIENGISYTLADILIDNRYINFYNKENNYISYKILKEMENNNENDILIFEMKNYLGMI